MRRWFGALMCNQAHRKHLGGTWWFVEDDASNWGGRFWTREEPAERYLIIEMEMWDAETVHTLDPAATQSAVILKHGAIWEGMERQIEAFQRSNGDPTFAMEVRLSRTGGIHNEVTVRAASRS